jgi:hypothetical protein
MEALIGRRRRTMRNEEDESSTIEIVIPDVFDDPRPGILDARGQRFERAAGFTRRLLRMTRACHTPRK